MEFLQSFLRRGISWETGEMQWWSSEFRLFPYAAFAPAVIVLHLGNGKLEKLLTLNSQPHTRKTYYYSYNQERLKASSPLKMRNIHWRK